MNTVGIVVVLAPATGPSIGGLLITSLSWKWLFLINLPIGLTGLVLGKLFLPRDEIRRIAPLDVTGLVLLTAALPLIIFGIIQMTEHHSFSVTPVLATLPVGALAFAAYLVHAGRSTPERTALLNLQLFRSRPYAAAQLAVLLSGVSLYGGLIILPLYYQILRHKSVQETGFLLLAYGAGSALSLKPDGVLTDRIGGGRTAVAGLMLVIFATLPFVVLPANASLVIVESLQFVRGVGVSLAGLPVMSSAYALVDKDNLPDATVQANILQRVGGSFGSALFVIVLEQRSPVGLPEFRSVFGWLTATAALALTTAGWLAVEQTRRSALMIIEEESR